MNLVAATAVAEAPPAPGPSSSDGQGATGTEGDSSTSPSFSDALSSAGGGSASGDIPGSGARPAHGRKDDHSPSDHAATPDTTSQAAFQPAATPGSAPTDAATMSGAVTGMPPPVCSTQPESAQAQTVSTAESTITAASSAAFGASTARLIGLAGFASTTTSAGSSAPAASPRQPADSSGDGTSGNGGAAASRPSAPWYATLAGTDSASDSSGASQSQATPGSQLAAGSSDSQPANGESAIAQIGMTAASSWMFGARIAQRSDGAQAAAGCAESVWTQLSGETNGASGTSRPTAADQAGTPSPVPTGTALFGGQATISGQSTEQYYDLGSDGRLTITLPRQPGLWDGAEAPVPALTEQLADELHTATGSAQAAGTTLTQDNGSGSAADTADAALPEDGEVGNATLPVAMAPASMDGAAAADEESASADALLTAGASATAAGAPLADGIQSAIDALGQRSEYGMGDPEPGYGWSSPPVLGNDQAPGHHSIGARHRNVQSTGQTDGAVQQNETIDDRSAPRDDIDPASGKQSGLQGQALLPGVTPQSAASAASRAAAATAGAAHATAALLSRSTAQQEQAARLAPGVDAISEAGADTLRSFVARQSSTEGGGSADTGDLSQRDGGGHGSSAGRRATDASQTGQPAGAFLVASDGTTGGANRSGPSATGDALDVQASFQPVVDGVLVRHAALHVSGSSSSFRVVLEPKSLGQVIVNVVHGHDGLQVSLTPQRDETGTLLHAHVAELVASLNAASSGSVHATVVVRGGSAGGSSPFSMGGQSTGSQDSAGQGFSTSGGDSQAGRQNADADRSYLVQQQQGLQTASRTGVRIGRSAGLGVVAAHIDVHV